MFRQAERDHYEKPFCNNVGNARKYWEFINDINNKKEKV